MMGVQRMTTFELGSTGLDAGVNEEGGDSRGVNFELHEKYQDWPGGSENGLVLMH